MAKRKFEFEVDEEVVEHIEKHGFVPVLRWEFASGGAIWLCTEGEAFVNIRALSERFDFRDGAWHRKGGDEPGK